MKHSAEAWSAFSHEARLTLHTMIGYVRLMKIDASGEMLERTAILERCSAHLLDLVQDYGQNQQVRTATTSEDEAEATPQMFALPENELQVFETMVDSGLLLRMQEWAIDLAEVYPEHQAAAHRVAQLARSSQLPALSAMLEHWRTLTQP